MAQMTFMDGDQDDRSSTPARPPRSAAAVLSATAAGGTVGVPLLGMAGLAFTASLLLLLAASPLLIVFSPVLLPAALLLAAAVAAFGAAAAVAVAGAAALSCAAAQAVGLRRALGRPVETLSTESVQRGKQLSATVAGGAALGVPLLGMTVLAFTASLGLLLVASPFLVVFSPLLLPAALVLAASLAGFGAAAAMAVAGAAALSCAARAAGLRIEGPVGRFLETLTPSGQRVEQKGVDMGGYMKALLQPQEGRVNQS